MASPYEPVEPRWLIASHLAFELKITGYLGWGRTGNVFAADIVGPETIGVAIKVTNKLEYVAGLEMEADYYRTQLKHLQGTVVPRFYGLFKPTNPSESEPCRLLVLERCGDWIHGGHGVAPEISNFERQVDRLPAMVLRYFGSTTILPYRWLITSHFWKLIEAGVLHMDIRRENILRAKPDHTGFRIIDFEDVSLEYSSLAKRIGIYQMLWAQNLGVVDCLSGADPI